MEMTDFWAVLFNPDAQAKFVHTVSAGYVTGGGVRAGDPCLVFAARARPGIRQALLRIAAAFRLGLGACP